MRKFLKIITGKSILLTWMMSYILVLLATMLISGFIHFNTLKIVEDSIVDNSLSSMKNIEKSVDNLVSNIESIKEQLLFDKNLDIIADADETNMNSLRYETYVFSKQMAFYGLAIKNEADMTMFFEGSNLAVRNNVTTNLNDWFYINGLDQYLTYDEWKRSTLNNLNDGFTRLVSKDGLKSKLFYYSTIIPSRYQDMGKSVSMIVMLNENVFTEKLVDFEYLNEANASFLIYNKNGTIMSTKGSVDVSIINQDEMQRNSGYYSSAKHTVAYVKSEITNITYICAIPKEVFWHKLVSVRNSIFYTILFSLVIGILTAYFMAIRNYKPVDKIVKIFDYGNEQSKIAPENEFNYIERSLSKLLNEKENAVELLRAQKNIVRTSLLTKLLQGKFNDTTALENALSENGVTFCSEFFSVILLSLDDYKKLFEDEESMSDVERNETYRFILTNVFQEMVSENNIGYVFELDNMIACIINFEDGNDVENKDKIRNLADRLLRFMCSQFNVWVSVASGDIHQTLGGIRMAFGEAVETMEYKTVMGIEEFVGFNVLESSDEKPTYSYTVEKEWQLIGAIKAGKYNYAVEILDSVLGQSNVNLQRSKCLVFDLISTVIKTTDEIMGANSDEFIKKIIDIDGLMKSVSIKETRTEILKILQQLCEYVSENFVKSDIVEKAKVYISSHYLDYGLNVEAVGNEFRLSASYLSKMFKDKTGKSILECINDIRMGKAREMLLGTDDTVEDVAAKCGYANVHTFLRIFKKHFGMTPGKFRTLN